MDSIYKDIILDHYRSPRNYGHVEKPTGSVSLSNPLCGDEITLQILTDAKGVIQDIKYKAVGCVLSLSSASLLSEYAKGKKGTSLKQLDPAFMLQLTGVTVGPTRLKCVLLPLEALTKVIQVSYDKSPHSR